MIEESEKWNRMSQCNITDNVFIVERGHLYRLLRAMTLREYCVLLFPTFSMNFGLHYMILFRSLVCCLLGKN
jgi:hypothetical protein